VASSLLAATAAPLAALGRVALFGGALLRRLCSRPWFFHEVMVHTATTCARCLLPVLAVTFPLGMVMSLQGIAIFRLFGAERMLSSLVAVATLRELSPVLASVLVAAQGGSAVAASLGSMRIQEELDATEVMAVDALRLHALPRVLGLTLATPILNVLGSVGALAGGFLCAVVLKGQAAGVFLGGLWTFARPGDLWGGLLKTTLFGATIGLTAAWHGTRATGGAAGVGRAVNDTVVHSVLAFITLNYFLTSALLAGGAP
jgi:phospholipid/cholesterol/gamma-HCH transport system permease protein